MCVRNSEVSQRADFIYLGLLNVRKLEKTIFEQWPTDFAYFDTTSTELVINVFRKAIEYNWEENIPLVIISQIYLCQTVRADSVAVICSPDHESVRNISTCGWKKYYQELKVNLEISFCRKIFRNFHLKFPSGSMFPLARYFDSPCCSRLNRSILETSLPHLPGKPESKLSMEFLGKTCVI